MSSSTLVTYLSSGIGLLISGNPDYSVFQPLGRLEDRTVLTPDLRDADPDAASADDISRIVRNIASTSCLRHLFRQLAPFYSRYPVFCARIYESLLRYAKQTYVQPTEQEVEKLPGSQYLLAWLRSAHAWRYYVPVASADQMRAAQPLADAVDFWRYFSASFHVAMSSDGTSYSILYSVLSPNSTLVMDFSEFPDGRCAIKQEYGFGDGLFPRYARTVQERIRETQGEELDRITRTYREQIEQTRQAQVAAELMRQTKFLCSQLSRDTRLLSAGNRASIFCELDSNSYDDGFLLSLRVGITKKYVVRRILDFLYAFEGEETVRYGKQFELCHTLENFDDSSRAVIRLLLSHLDGLEYQDRVKQIALSTPLTMELLALLQGHDVEMDSVLYRVRWDALPVRYSVDAQLQLHYALPEPEHSRYFWDMGDAILVLDKTAYTIDRLDLPKKDLPFFKYAIRSAGVSLAPVLDLFNQEIYPRYANAIEVSPEAREKIRLSELHIDAYFDYQDGIVTCREKLSCDGKPVTVKSLKKSLDLQRYRRFTEALAQLGFVEGALRDETALLMFLRMDFGPLREVCDVFLSDSLQNKTLAKLPRQLIQIQRNGSMMEAFLQNSDFDQNELEEIYQAARRKKKFVLLKDNRIVDLEDPDTADFTKAVADLGLAEKHLYAQKQIAMTQALRALAHESSCRVDDYLKRMLEDIRNFQTADIPLPELSATLRPYQVEAYRWLRILCSYHMGGILADDMGLGKTLEMIALLVSDPNPRPRLIVCPKTLVFNWKNEFARFAPGVETVEVCGTAASRKARISSIAPDRPVTFITSYDSLARDVDLYRDVPFCYAVLDEAQSIKNARAQRTQGVKQLQAEHCFALTGTPIENNLLDLWSIFDFVLPGYLEEISDFKAAYGRDSDNYLKKIAGRIAPFVLRRTKQDVLADLPEKYERVLTAEMTTPQKKLYAAFVKQARERMEEGGKLFDMLPYLTRLRQICVDPSMFLENFDGPSGKLLELEELLQEYLENGHRILIFSQFVKGLQSVETLLQSKGIAYYMLTGDTPGPERLKMVEQFNGSAAVPVFLISLKAGGTGLNLTGADTVIHLDPWWNVAAENQASDRAHRIGQTRNVEVIKLVCADSIEQRVIELQNQKKDIIDKVISNDASSVTGASLEDITFLLKDR